MKLVINRLYQASAYFAGKIGSRIRPSDDWGKDPYPDLLVSQKTNLQTYNTLDRFLKRFVGELTLFLYPVLLNLNLFLYPESVFYRNPLIAASGH